MGGEDSAATGVEQTGPGVPTPRTGEPEAVPASAKAAAKSPAKRTAKAAAKSPAKSAAKAKPKPRKGSAAAAEVPVQRTDAEEAARNPGEGPRAGESRTAAEAPIPAEPAGAVPAESSESAESTRPATTLGARERAVLDFEARRWPNPGVKEQAVRDAFDLPPTRYYQILNALLDDPAALAYRPVLVARLRRIREARQRARR